MYCLIDLALTPPIFSRNNLGSTAEYIILYIRLKVKLSHRIEWNVENDDISSRSLFPFVSDIR